MPPRRTAFAMARERCTAFGIPLHFRGVAVVFGVVSLGFFICGACFITLSSSFGGNYYSGTDFQESWDTISRYYSTCPLPDCPAPAKLCWSPQYAVPGSTIVCVEDCTPPASPASDPCVWLAQSSNYYLAIICTGFGMILLSISFASLAVWTHRLAPDAFFFELLKIKSNSGVKSWTGSDSSETVVKTLELRRGCSRKQRWRTAVVGVLPSMLLDTGDASQEWLKSDVYGMFSPTVWAVILNDWPTALFLKQFQGSSAAT